MKINKKISKYNHDKYTNRDIKYIVIHYVGTTSTAKNNVDYFAGGDRQASAHYFVDDTSIWQSVEDKNAAWAVGSSGLLDQGSPYAKYGGKLFGKCTNKNSISIEMCCKKKSGKIYITDATIKNTAELVQSLQKKYGIKDDKVVRHFDVNGKLCPLPYVETTKWKKLREELTQTSEAVEGLKVLEKCKTKGKLNIRTGPGTSFKITGSYKKGTTLNIRDHNTDKTWGYTENGWCNITEKYVEKI
ncbi:N-acetylmuramoyl-L-alanine amidase CwlA [Clostridiales Family XIII bacterium PM5-7]